LHVAVDVFHAKVHQGRWTLRPRVQASSRSR
jgi:hypothetical protein